MKKNLFIAMGMVAAFGVLACGGNGKDEPKNPTNTDTATDAKTDANTDTNTDASTETDNGNASKCENVVMEDGATELVCGTCATADETKGECLNIGYEGAATIPATLTCTENGSAKVWVATLKTGCMDTEVCKAGVCEYDESKLGACANPTYSCDGDTLKVDYPDGCSDFADDEIDCSELGGCDAANKACKHLNGICDDGEKAVETVCDGRTVVVKNLDVACSKGNYAGSYIDSERSCLTLKVNLVDDDDDTEITVAGTCVEDDDDAICVKDERDCTTDEIAKRKHVCVGDDQYSYNTTCGSIEKMQGECSDYVDVEPAEE